MNLYEIVCMRLYVQTLNSMALKLDVTKLVGHSVTQAMTDMLPLIPSRVWNTLSLLINTVQNVLHSKITMAIAGMIGSRPNMMCFSVFSLQSKLWRNKLGQSQRKLTFSDFISEL